MFFSPPNAPKCGSAALSSFDEFHSPTVRRGKAQNMLRRQEEQMDRK